MKRISIQDLKAGLSAAISEAESGSTIVITRHSEPVAQLIPAYSQHVHRGKVVGKRALKPAIERGKKSHTWSFFWKIEELWFHGTERIDRFVTMDASQEQAAKELGLPT